MTRDMAVQELNRLIDFYRDMVSKSNYKSADHTIKQKDHRSGITYKKNDRKYVSNEHRKRYRSNKSRLKKLSLSSQQRALRWEA